MMGTMVMVMIAVLALLLDEGYLVDICLLYAMISFLAVVVLSKVYIGIYEEKRHKAENPDEDEEGGMSDGSFEWIRLIVGGVFLISGLATFFTEIFGVFHFRYVLNRMHATAMGDTLGISSCMVGLMIFSGWNFTTLKLLLVVVFLWFASPVSSHVLARLEVATNENLEDHCTVYPELKMLEEELAAAADPAKQADPASSDQTKA